MKKSLFILFFLLAAVLAFTEELTGFMGIDFGTTKAEASKIIESKGYSLIKNQDDMSTYLNPTGVCFGLPAQRIILSYSENNLLVSGTFLSDIDESMKDDVFTTFKAFQKTFNLEPQDVEEDANRMSFYYIAPNKNRFIVTLFPGMAAFTFGYRNTDKNSQETLQLSNFLDKWLDAKYITLSYSLILQKDNSFIFVASGENIDGMATGTYIINDDILSFSTLSYRGKNVNLIFRQSESYKIESITANGFIMKNTNAPDELLSRSITFKLKN